MAEGLATAASGIAVLTVAVQLAQSIKKLSDFWTSIKEAPKDIQATSTELVLLSTVFTRIAHQTQHIEPDITFAAILNECLVKVEEVTALLDEMEPGFASSRLRVRKWTAFKAVLKKGQLQKFQVALDRLKGTLLLIQLEQYSRLSRHQHLSLERNLMLLTQNVSSLSIPQRHSHIARRLSSSISDVDPSSHPSPVEESDLTNSLAGNSQSIESDKSDTDGPLRKYTWLKRTVQRASSVMECSLGTLRAESNTQLRVSAEMGDVMLCNEQDQGEDETSYTVYPARWLIRLGIRYGFRLTFVSSATQGWRTTLKPFCPVPDDALIFEFCKQGNTAAVRELLSGGYASVRDTDSRGYTPLHFAAQNYHPALCETLKGAGADINALTYDGPTWRAMTPMLLAAGSSHITYTTLSNGFDTLRLLTDSMDLSDANANGWLVLFRLYDGVACIGGETEAQSALLLWMLKLLTYELKACSIRSEFASLLECTLRPHPGLEPVSNLLLKLADTNIIDAQDGIDGYTVLHRRLACAENAELLSRVLAKGPNIHLQGFNKFCTPEKESPMSLAMYSSWAFADLLHGLIDVEIDFSTFIDQELENNALLHPKWDQETLHELFDYPARPDMYFPHHQICNDCDTSEFIIRVQPYWRHLLERIKQRTDPDDPFRRDGGVDETQISNIRSGMEASNNSDHDPNISGSASLDEFNDDVGSEGEFESEVQLGSDVHGYPENVSVRSDCVYEKDEIVCMDCWLHYRRTGTRFEVEDSSIDEYSSSEDESSDDEFSPYHIHS